MRDNSTTVERPYLSPSWEPDDRSWEYAMRQGVDPDLLAKDMHKHFRSNGGFDKGDAYWNDVFREGVRNAVKDGTCQLVKRWQE